MAVGAIADNLPLGLQTPLKGDVLLLDGITGVEELSSPFQYELELQSEDDNIDPGKLVGFPVTVRVEAGNLVTRYLNGFISEFTHVAWGDRYSRYRARMVPWLWFLGQTANCRIFQDMSAPDIIEEIFKEPTGKGPLKFTDYEFQLSEKYPAYEYCVQYRESCLDFVQRIAWENGIFYFFKHENQKHTLVLADSPSAYFEIPDSQVNFPDQAHSFARQNLVTSWSRNYQFRSGKYTHTDYNFKQPSTKLFRDQASKKLPYRSAQDFEVYDYHGRHQDTDRGKALARIRMEEIECRHDVGQGDSTCGTFTPGGRFAFASHRSDAEIGNSYVLTRVTLEARLEGMGPGALGALTFHNQFECIPASTPFRPEQPGKKPRVEGPQTAVIVGPDEEKPGGIHVDEYSRVKAQFHWDREHDRDDEMCCWMRVSQAHAGKGWGYIDIPRVGEEVIVDFLEGDPDRPIITGRVYNGEVMPPFPLAKGDNAKNKTRRGNTTKTYKGDGYNEMTMDDTKGKEQIRVHAQYNMDTTVEHDDTQTVHNDRTITVDGTHTETIKKDTTIKITEGKYDFDVVDNTAKIHVKKDITENYDAKQNVTVLEDQNTTVKKNRTIHVSDEHDTLTVEKGNHTVNVGKGHSTMKVETGNRDVVVSKGSYQLSTPSKHVIIKAGDKIIAIGENEVSVSSKKIKITATEEITIGVGNNTIVINKQEIKSGATKITTAAIGVHEISGALIKIN